MLIATFGPSTGRAGKTIEIVGAVIAVAVLAAFALTACGDAAEVTPTGAPTAASESAPHTLVGNWKADSSVHSTLHIEARKNGAYAVAWKMGGGKPTMFIVKRKSHDVYGVPGDHESVFTLVGDERLEISSKSGESLSFTRTSKATKKDLAAAEEQEAIAEAKALLGESDPSSGSSGGSRPGLAERVAADLDPRADYTSFDIPTPKVKVTGSAYGGGKIVSITYYVAGDDIFNENAFVDGVSPATVDVMAGAFSQPDVGIVDVTWKTDFTDSYGKSSKDAAFQIRWKRKTFKKVDINGLFDRVATSPEDLYLISDWYSIHPAIWKATHLKDQIPAIDGN